MAIHLESPEQWVTHFEGVADKVQRNLDRAAAMTEDQRLQAFGEDGLQIQEWLLGDAVALAAMWRDRIAS